MSIREKTLRYMLLIIGVFFIGLGIAVAKHSNLGTSPISSVANVLSIRFPALTVGTWLMVFNCVMIIAQIIILKRNFKPIQFLQFPISLLLGVFTDLNVLLVSSIPIYNYIVKILFAFVSVLILALGITFTIISDMVMNVGEAMVDVIAKVTHKSFGNIKVIFDIGCVIAAVVLSILFFNFKIIGVREGTIITATFTGFVIKFLTKKLKSPILKIISSK